MQQGFDWRKINFDVLDDGLTRPKKPQRLIFN